VNISVGHWRKIQKIGLILERDVEGVDRWEQITWSRYRTRVDLFIYLFVDY